MKMFHICALILTAITNASIAMNVEEEHELSAQEKAYYVWFAQQQEKLPSLYQKLSPEDCEVFNKRICYADNPQAVTTSRYHYADVFYDTARATNLELQYDKETLQRTLLKMTKMMQSKSIQRPTDLVSARMYVFSTLLTPEEQATYTEENYRNNPDATDCVVHRFSRLLAHELAKLNLIDNTDEAQDHKAKELYEDRMAWFKTQYTHS